MLNPVHLKTLAAVLESGSFAEAGRILGYTASAVSQQIVALEKTVGTNLFERGVQSARATLEAELVSERARDWLLVLDGLESDIRGIVSGSGGRLRVGSNATASFKLVPRALASVQEARPAVEFRLKEGVPESLLIPLLGGELDIAIVYKYDCVPRIWPDRLVETPLISEDILLLLSDQHLQTEGSVVNLVDLADEHWISSYEESDGAEFLSRICAVAGFDPQVDFRSNNYSAVRGFVHAGLGVALIPALGHHPTLGIKTARLGGPRYQRHISVLYRPENTNPLIPVVLEALHQSSEALARDPDLSWLISSR